MKTPGLAGNRTIPPEAPAIPPSAQLEPGSFRDRDGRVFYVRQQVFRALSAEMNAHWQQLQLTPFYQHHQALGDVIRTRALTAAEWQEGSSFPGPPGKWAGCLEHERLPIITYPYEWCFGMARTAALLQLQLLGDALRDGWILKDATPFNVQFRGVQPVFIDVGSFQPYVTGTPWAAYRQFCMMFLYPLLLQAYRGVDHQGWLRASLQGITPETCRRLFSWMDCWRRGLLTHVFLHALLDRRVQSDSQQVSRELQQQGFDRRLIEQNVRGLQRLIDGLHWRIPESRWSGYAAATATDAAQIQAKAEFVSQVARTRHWPTVWDLGCNAGRYSQIVEEHADLVVAMDSDHATVEKLYQELRRSQSTKIVPLCVNLADPSPNLGWRGQERQSLTQRSRPDLVLCLAVIHHLVLAENLLLEDVLETLRDHQGDVVLEFVDRSDPQVQSLLAHRSDGGHAYSLALLEALLPTRFSVVRRELLPGGTRTLFWLRALPRLLDAESPTPIASPPILPAP